MTLLIERIESDEDLARALKVRRNQMGVTQEDVEHAVGLTQGHLGKVEHGGKTWGKQVLRMTATLLWLLEYYGLSLMIVDRQTAEIIDPSKIQRHDRCHLRKKTQTQHPNGQRLTVRMTRRPLLGRSGARGAR